MNALSLVDLVAGFLLIVLALSDAFETIILPRTVKRSVRISSMFFFFTRFCYRVVGSMRKTAIQQRISVSFAPLIVFLLIGFWALLLIVGFALVGVGFNTPFQGNASTDFVNRLYFSGTTFFTLGFGDFVPESLVGKFLAILEAGTGFGFLALVIGYVPVFYAAFSKREQTILLLDSKAGSEPIASEIFRRYAEAGCMDELPALFKEWEQFSAALLENFLSYPILALYRSQHDEQSWLTSLVAVMDACALAMCCYPGDDPVAKKIRFQATSTFTMARHLIVDFAYVVASEPSKPADRCSTGQYASIVKLVGNHGLVLNTDPASLQKLTEIRHLYEPFAQGLADHLRMDMPKWIRAENVHDNWETTAWDGTHF